MNSFLTAALFSIGVFTSTSCADKIDTVQVKPTKSSQKKVAKKSSFYPSTDVADSRAKATGKSRDKHGMPTYTPSQRKRYVRTTAYSCAENEPGAHGSKNAMGTILKYGSTVRSAAADWSRYPVGTKFKIKGLPYTYVVDDYGSALVGTNTVDIYHPTLRGMNRWGTRKVEINVIQWGSTARTLALLKGRTKYKHCARMYYAMKKNQSKFQTASN